MVGIFGNRPSKGTLQIRAYTSRTTKEKLKTDIISLTAACGKDVKISQTTLFMEGLNVYGFCVGTDDSKKYPAGDPEPEDICPIRENKYLSG